MAQSSRGHQSQESPPLMLRITDRGPEWDQVRNGAGSCMGSFTLGPAPPNAGTSPAAGLLCPAPLHIVPAPLHIAHATLHIAQLLYKPPMQLYISPMQLYISSQQLAISYQQPQKTQTKTKMRPEDVSDGQYIQNFAPNLHFNIGAHQNASRYEFFKKGKN